MPFPLIPLIGAGASILGNVLTGASNAKQNRAQRDYNTSMYERQRRDSLSDWAMQNEYNSPQNQMNRLKGAGLNPNLIYGTGSASTGASTPIRSTNAESYKPEATRYDFGGVSNSLMSYYDTQVKQAQIDNLKVANTVATQDALLKAAQTASTVASTANTTASTATSQFNLKQAEALQSTTIERAQADLAKVRVDTDYTLNQDERARMQNVASLSEAAERILSARLGRVKTDSERRMIEQQIKSVQLDQKIKDLDIELKRLGIQPSDALWQRALGRIIGDPADWKFDLKSQPKQMTRPLMDSMGLPSNGLKKYLDGRKKSH